MENIIADTSIWTMIAAALGFGILIQIVLLIKTRYRPGLRQIPGPFLASVSSLDRLWSCAGGLQMNYHLKLHEEYGPLVRIGPKHVSFSDARLIPQIYSISSKFYKVSRNDLPTKASVLTRIRATSTQCSTSRHRQARCRRFSPLETRPCISRSSGL